MGLSERELKTYLGKLDVADLQKQQRQCGRAGLSPEFKEFWASQHERAVELDGELGRGAAVRKAIGLLKDVTYSLHALETDAINAAPSYYPYTDAHILDRYLGDSRLPNHVRKQRAVDGIYHLLVNTAHFESRSLIGAEKNHRDRVSDSALLRRLGVLQDAMRAYEDLARVVGVTSCEQATYYDIIPFQTLEEYAGQQSQLGSLLSFTPMPQTQFHDEVLFLRVIHISEFCFFGIHLLLVEAREHIRHDQPASAMQCVSEAIEFAVMLHMSFKVLHTMPPEHFADFRDATGRASAVQSRNYQIMDIVLHGVNPDKAAVYKETPHLNYLKKYAQPGYESFGKVLKCQPESHARWAELFAAARRLDAKLKTWRGYHIMFAKTYLPPEAVGTGATSGASYLKRVLQFGLFDDTEIDYAAIAALFPGEKIDGISRVPPGTTSIAPTEYARR